MQILVLGSGGQLATALSRVVWPKGVCATYLDRKAADLSRPKHIGEVVLTCRPDVVVIAAGYTRVDAAESDEPTAHAVNATGPRAVARAAAELSAPVVYLSTDYVFDGAKQGFYDEDDPVHPLNAYGRSKLAGEAAVRAENPRHLILRTSWLYGASGTNFLLTMLKRANECAVVRVVGDQRGCPTAVDDLAAAIAKVATSSRFRRRTLRYLPSRRRYRHDLARLRGGNLRGDGHSRSRAPQEHGDHDRRPSNAGAEAIEQPALKCALCQRVRDHAPGFQEALPTVLDEALQQGAPKETESTAS